MYVKGSLYSILEQDNLHVLSEFCFFETRTRSKPNKQHLFIKFYKIIFRKSNDSYLQFTKLTKIYNIWYGINKIYDPFMCLSNKQGVHPSITFVQQKAYVL